MSLSIVRLRGIGLVSRTSDEFITLDPEYYWCVKMKRPQQCRNPTLARICMHRQTRWTDRWTRWTDRQTYTCLLYTSDAADD